MSKEIQDLLKKMKEQLEQKPKPSPVPPRDPKTQVIIIKK